jgi:hypothetical protein
MTAFGLRIMLLEDGQVEDKAEKRLLTIGISGDTAINSLDKNSDKYTDGSELASFYDGVDLLILHVGGIERPSTPRYDGDHLGFQGVVEILTRVKNPPKMVILTEWGYEFGRLGLNGRTNFTRFVAAEVNKNGKLDYYAAIKDKRDACYWGRRDGIPIFPADITLRIRLPDLYIKTNNPSFEDYHMVYAQESLEQIDYCIDPSPFAEKAS